MLTQYLSKVAMMGAEWVLYVLGVMSVLTVAMMVDRIWVFARTRKNLRQLEAPLVGGVAAPDGSGLLPGLEPRILKAVEGIQQGGADEDADVVSERAGAILASYRRSLERFLPFLGTMSNIAPYLGLFGTVIGVIQALAALGVDPNVGIGTVMIGISEALVTTGAGLAVAIPSVVAHNFFSRMVDEYVDRLTPVVWQRLLSGRRQ